MHLPLPENVPYHDHDDCYDDDDLDYDDSYDDDDNKFLSLYLVKNVAGAWPGLMYTSLCQVPFKITLKLKQTFWCHPRRKCCSRQVIYQDGSRRLSQLAHRRLSCFQV